MHPFSSKIKKGQNLSKLFSQKKNCEDEKKNMQTRRWDVSTWNTLNRLVGRFDETSIYLTDIEVFSEIDL